MNPAIPDRPRLSRRQLLAAMGLASGATEMARTGQALARTGRTLGRAAAVRAAVSDLGAVEHVIFLMQENRSYDHYFGTYPKGRGFDDHPRHRLGVFAQGYPGGKKMDPAKVLLPFRLRRPRDECTKDLDHNWGVMHHCWNHGKMDRWVRVHTSDEGEGNPTGALTMG